MASSNNTSQALSLTEFIQNFYLVFTLAILA